MLWQHSIAQVQRGDQVVEAAPHHPVSKPLSNDESRLLLDLFEFQGESQNVDPLAVLDLLANAWRKTGIF